MLIRTIEKPEENRVFFEFGPAKTREGDTPVALTTEREHAEALIAKQNWEAKNPGKMFVHFHKDPMAGGAVRHPGLSGGQMISFSLWAGEYIVRQYKDDNHG